MWCDHVVVCAANAASYERAAAIALQLNLSMIDLLDVAEIALMVDQKKAWLHYNTKPPMDWHIDFLSSAYTGRRSQRSRRKDPLTRAIGLHKKKALRVLDMSAGLGKDAHWLAYCGAEVTLVERNPLLSFLLSEAINALRIDSVEGSVGERMILIENDAKFFLETLSSGMYDVAYYDPMFLPRQKSALVKKDMQIMHALLGNEEASDILQFTLSKIPRVVVKRAKADPAYYKGAPHIAIEAGVVRYEIYQ